MSVEARDQQDRASVAEHPLADLDRTLATLLGDAGLRERLETAGHERAREFSWERVLAEHETACEGAIRTWKRR